MDEWIGSGRFVALVAAGVVLEFVALAWLARRRGRPAFVAGLAATLVAGLCLLMALHAALTGGGVAAVGGWLAAAGIAHAIDMALRFRA